MAQYNILLVDNNSKRRKRLANLLREINYVFSEACTGSQAFDLLSKNSYDLVFIDINLPKINGAEVTKMIRKKLPFPKNRIRIIANASCTYNEFFSKYYDAGFNDVLPQTQSAESIKTLIDYHVDFKKVY